MSKMARCVSVCAVVLAVGVIVLGTGCLPNLVLPDFLQPNPIWINLTTGNYWEVDTEGTAAANVQDATGTVTYEWSITSPATLIGSDHDVVARFTATQPCSATLVLTVTDSGTGTSATNAAQVEFGEGTTPQADAGEDTTVAVGGTVLLLGSWSGDDSSGQGYFDYTWRQASGPAQTIASSEDVLGRAITVVGTTPGTAVFEFIVWNAYTGQTATDTATVTVTP